mmetsp:Transcript_118416/g.339962  ORF Transcript_118416/g.339962 Transcript_118416/m.339962 type:complete len:374 (-) Transcript_118416:544-1665(-)
MRKAVNHSAGSGESSSGSATHKPSNLEPRYRTVLRSFLSGVPLFCWPGCLFHLVRSNLEISCLARGPGTTGANARRPSTGAFGGFEHAVHLKVNPSMTISVLTAASTGGGRRAGLKAEQMLVRGDGRNSVNAETVKLPREKAWLRTSTSCTAPGNTVRTTGASSTSPFTSSSAALTAGKAPRTRSPTRYCAAVLRNEARCVLCKTHTLKSTSNKPVDTWTLSGTHCGDFDASARSTRSMKRKASARLINSKIGTSSMRKPKKDSWCDPVPVKWNASVRSKVMSHHAVSATTRASDACAADCGANDVENNRRSLTSRRYAPPTKSANAAHMIAALTGNAFGDCAPAIVTTVNQEKRELPGTTQASDNLAGTLSK